MNDKLNIILECMREIHADNIERLGKPIVVTVAALSSKIEYNYIAKAYDIIYDMSMDDFETEELIRILHQNKITHSYRGEVKYPSAKSLFEY